MHVSVFRVRCIASNGQMTNERTNERAETKKTHWETTKDSNLSIKRSGFHSRSVQAMCTTANWTQHQRCIARTTEKRARQRKKIAYKFDLESFIDLYKLCAQQVKHKYLLILNKARNQIHPYTNRLVCCCCRCCGCGCDRPRCCREPHKKIRIKVGHFIFIYSIAREL